VRSGTGCLGADLVAAFDLRWIVRAWADWASPRPDSPESRAARRDRSRHVGKLRHGVARLVATKNARLL